MIAASSAPGLKFFNGLFRPQGFAAAVALLLITLALHGEALNQWWLEDDPQLLLQAMVESPGTIFFSPTRWRQYSASNFSPFASFAFKADYEIAGLNPRFFYIQHLLILWVAATLLFFYLRRFAGELLALLAAVLFLVQPGTMHAARILMLRHYVLGLCFALLALLFWERTGRVGAILSALFYLLAATSKEVFAPLPLVFLARAWIRHDSLRSVVANMIPSSCAAALYLLWRWWMLGSMGGYGADVSAADVVLLPAVSWGAMTRGSPWFLGLLWQIVLAGLAMRKLVSKPRLLVPVALLFLFAFLSLIPVAQTPLLRYAFLPSILAALAIPLLAESSTRWGRIALATGSLCVIAAGLCERRITNRAATKMIAEGKYVWSEPETARPLLARSHVWYIDGLRVLRQKSGRGKAPAVYMSLYGLALDQHQGFADLSSEPGTRPSLDLVLRTFRSDSNTKVRVHRDGNTLRWEFSPGGANQWMILSMPGYEARPIDSTGWFRFPRDSFPPSLFLAVEPAEFRVLRLDPAGGWMVSPVLAFPADGQSVASGAEAF